jgi:hypothetical protein
MIDSESFAEMTANVGIIRSSVHFLCTGDAVGVLGASRGRDSQRSKFLCKPYCRERSDFSLALLISLAYFFPPKHLNLNSYISSNALL